MPDSGSYPILGYTISNNSPPISCNFTESPAIITGLSPRITYNFSIAASNQNGYGPWTLYREIIPGLKPGPPENLKVVITNNGKSLYFIDTWTL
jgi:hypothetical protein